MTTVISVVEFQAREYKIRFSTKNEQVQSTEKEDRGAN